ncbi:MAG: sodium-dependent transporter [Halobacteria archaeon]
MSQWSSKFGFIFAAIGAAVGLGNIWRFPVVVENNGGGAFLLPYLFCTFFFGVTLMIVEVSGGREWGSDVVTTFRGLKKGWIGWIIAIVVTLELSYYLVIVGWTFGYIFIAASDFVITFDDFTNTLIPIAFFIGATVLTGYIVSRGVEDGIEKLVQFSIPFLFISLIVMVAFSTQLEKFTEGVSYFLEPDFSALKHPALWAAAFGQAFFSLSVGDGELLTYGSYLGEDSSIPKMSIVITIANFVIAFMVGFIIFPLIYTFHGGPAKVEGGRSLAFRILPKIFETIPFGTVFGVIFFIFLFVAAISSAIALFNVGNAVWVGKGVSQKRSATFMTVLLLVLGFPSALSYSSIGFNPFGMPWLDMMDVDTGTYGLTFSSLLTAVGFTWYMKKDIIKKNAVFYIVKYILPVALALNLVINFYNDFIVGNS